MVSAELRALARERTHEAMEVLTKIMQDPKAPAAARVAACRELFDRGYGRPESSVNAKIETKKALNLDVLTEAERAEFDAAATMLARFADRPGLVVDEDEPRGPAGTN